MRVTVSRKAHFNAAHRLYNEAWSAEKNAEVFGKCSNPNYHGHNYELIVSVTGAIDPQTGFVMDMKSIKGIIEKEVEIPFDHKNLNIDVAAFKTLIPTAENIAVVIYSRIKPYIHQTHSLKITLYETPRNFVEYSGE